MFYAEVEKAKRNGVQSIYNDIKLKDYLATWLENEKKATISYNTYRDYKVSINNHIVPSIGKIKLKELKKIHIRKLYADLGMEGKKLKNKTIKNIRSVLVMGLDAALAEDLISKNIARLIKISKPEKFEHEHLSDDDLIKIVKATENNDIEIAIFLACFGGLRRGECLGLKWKSVDIENNIMYINEQLVKGYNGYELSTPKTRSSIRKVGIQNILSEKLKEVKAKQKELQLELGKDYINKDLVFCKRNGDYYSTSMLDKNFSKLLKNSNITNIRFHDLRHTYSNKMNEAGCNLLTISKLMGHANPQTTYSTYLEQSDSMINDARKKANIKLESIMGDDKVEDFSNCYIIN